MNYEEFKTELMEAIRDELSMTDLEGVTLKQETIEAPFGPSDRLVVGHEDTNIAMAFKLQNMYEDLDSGAMDFNEIVDRATNTIVENFEGMVEKERMVKDVVFDFDKAKDHMLLRMVPGDSPILDDCPHKKIGDMAVVVQVVFEDFADPGSRSTAVVRTEMMDAMGIDEDKLFNTARDNAPEKDAITVKSIVGALAGMIPEDAIDEVPADRMLYVVSVESGLHGAAAIAYPDFHDKVSEKVSGNFYVIPSSVNEVLIISDKAADARGLNDMIREVNSTMVSPEERLSDQCLHYDAKARVFSIGTDHDDKMLQKQQKVGGPKR